MLPAAGARDWPNAKKRESWPHAGAGEGHRDRPQTRRYTLADFGAERRLVDQSKELFNDIWQIGFSATQEVADDELQAKFAEHPHVVRQPDNKRERAISQCIDKARARWSAAHDHPTADDFTLPEVPAAVRAR